MPKLRLIGNNILIRLEPRDERAGGIIIDPGVRADHKPRWAEVLGVGTGHPTRKGRVPLEVEVGDRVMVIPVIKETKQPQQLSREFFGRQDLLIVEEEDILLVEER